MSQINLTKVRSITESIPESKAVFELLEGFERARQDTSFKRLNRLLTAAKNKVPMDVLIEVFEALQAAGAGKVVFSHNRPARFVWDFKRQSVARVALGRRGLAARQAAPKVKLVDIPMPATPIERSVPKAAPQVTQDAGVMVVRRNGYTVELPLSLTSEQMERAKILIGGLEA